MALILSLLLSIGIANAAELAPAWSIDKLNGLHSYHEGPNCLNATLAGLGYSDYLIQTDGMELHFLLERFCKLQQGQPEPGDIMVLAEDTITDHAGIYLGNQRIFSKDSPSGLYGSDERLNLEDSLYESRALSEKNGRFCDKDYCFNHHFRCAPMASIRGELRECIAKAEVMGLRPAQAKLQQWTLDSKRTVKLDENLFALLERTTKSFAMLSGNDPCALYLISNGASIVGHLYSINAVHAALGAKGDKAIVQLRRALDAAKIRVLREDQSASTQKIFRSAWWVGKKEPLRQRH